MIRVCVVHDIIFVRDALEQVLMGNGDLLVVGAVGADDKGLSQLAELDPDVIVFDTPPGMNGALTSVRTRAPRAKVVGLGVPESEREVVACAGAGVSGYVSRENSIEDLIRTIRSVAHGEPVCPPRILATLLKVVAASEFAATIATDHGGLTPRELEVAGFIGRGLSNKEIAVHLNIGLHTVKSHAHNILRKLRARRRSEVLPRLSRSGFGA